MAGYIFGLSSLDSLHLYTKSGVYGTMLSVPPGHWQKHHEGTFADYATMKAGDSVYFFIDRRIYGIGKLVNLDSECRFLNHPEAGKPASVSYEQIRSDLLWDEGQTSVNQRCICIFEPDPHFFATGVDMDDVLSSNPSAFKMLRAFWKLSFVKFDDDENQAFRDILLKRNQEALATPDIGSAVFEYDPAHRHVQSRLGSADYALASGISSILTSCADGDHLKHEMALEAGILHQISARDAGTCAIFGEWDYLSHQVVASPFKPIDYMDKMDLFGYSYIPGFEPTKARFLVGEVKKDTAQLQDVDQLLKYVDWVRDEYCFGDYSMIRAFLVAHDFGEGARQHQRDVARRKYTTGVRPAVSQEWTNLKLVEYSFDPGSRRIVFSVVE